MTDRTTVEVTFAHTFRTADFKKATVVAEAKGSPRVVTAFDRTYDVTLHDGTVVPMGRLDGRSYVRAPWSMDLPVQGRVMEDLGVVRDWFETDPRWDQEGRRPGAVSRKPPRAVRASLEGDGPEAVSFAARRTTVEDWIGEGVVVDDVPYVPTAGASVHLPKVPHGAGLRPMVRFGWGDGRIGEGVVTNWCDGWRPVSSVEGWEPGAVHVPADVLAPVGALAMQSLPHAWIDRVSRAGPGDLRTSPLWLARVTGDWVASAAAYVSDGGPSVREPKDVVALSEAVASMSPAQRARFDALTVAPGAIPEATAEALDTLAPTP